MSDTNPIAFPNGIARVLSRGDLENYPGWTRAFEGKIKDHRFYELVADTLGSNFEHHYLALEDLTGRVRGIQPVFFVQQNLVEGIPALRKAVEKVRRRFPRFLTMRVLMIGNAAGEGHLSALAPENEAWVAAALHEVLPSFARQSKASLIVFKDFPALRIIISHGGGSVPYQVGRWRAHRIREQEANPSLESFDEGMRRLYYDTVLYNQESLELLFRVLGTDRCMFGTENPGSGSSKDPRTGVPMDDLKPVIESISWLSEADRSRLFTDNARAVFPGFNVSAPV